VLSETRRQKASATLADAEQRSEPVCLSVAEPRSSARIID
jgi:hypothetical protein